MSRAEKAEKIFNGGFSCSQSVLSVFAEEFGLERDIALRLAGGFGGGMAGSGGRCGAVTGAMMVLGLRYGRTVAGDEVASERTYLAIAEFLRIFGERHGETDCSALLGMEMGSVEGKEKAASLGLYRTLCPNFVKSAVEIVESLI